MLRHAEHEALQHRTEQLKHSAWGAGRATAASRLTCMKGFMIQSEKEGRYCQNEGRMYTRGFFSSWPCWSAMIAAALPANMALATISGRLRSVGAGRRFRARPRPVRRVSSDTRQKMLAMFEDQAAVQARAMQELSRHKLVAQLADGRCYKCRAGVTTPAMLAEGGIHTGATHRRSCASL